MVTILVGSTKTRLLAHQGVFDQPHAGGFFNAAFTNGFKESSDGVLELPEDDRKTFGIFMKWLYDMSLRLDSARVSISSVLEDVQSHISMFIFAQKYLCYDLQDRIMTFMFMWINEGHKVETELNQDKLQDFTTNLQPSHMHTMLAKWIAKDTLLGDIKDATAYDKVPNELLRIVMREMRGCANERQVEDMLGFLVRLPPPQKD